MKVQNVGSNMTEVVTDDRIVLVSYSTPVAFEERASGFCFVTTEKHSATTSKHIARWLDGRRPQGTFPQSFFDNIL